MSGSRNSTVTEVWESRLEAAPAVLLVLALQVLLSMVSLGQGWTLWVLPWWTWLIPIAPELVLIVLFLTPPRRRGEALALLAVVGVTNALAMVALIGSVTSGHETSGGQLLFKGAVVWATNVIAFGLGFWELDGGGPAARLRDPSGWRDFQFPQMENPRLVSEGEDWQPHLIDYLYLSFTNSMAWSPTDAMPLSKAAKGLMGAGAAVSALTVLLVAARAVNIFR